LFIGPTLQPHDLPSDHDIVMRPPVAQGDVYRAACEKPVAIAIVDGYFEGKISVWHKEILWAMSEGVHVFGSASMGALRAAELHQFGMRGIGWIFEAYRDGLLDDDDEVAVIHGPADANYVPLSEPMVNVRRTLSAAEGDGIISAETRHELIRRVKELFYHHRSFDHLFKIAAAGSIPEYEIRALRSWLPHGRIDQKRQDALAMIESLGRFVAGGPGPMVVDYVFEWTDAWEHAIGDNQ
jgi:hypothetical protein